MRFSYSNLVDIIRQLWPMIYSDLVEGLISSRKKEVVYPILKFAEFLSVVNRDYFTLNQWAFFQDTNDVSRLKINESQNALKNSPCFKPYVMNLLKHNISENEFRNDDFENNSRRGKKSLVLKLNKVENEEQLITSASNLMVSINLDNQYESVVDWLDIERIVETDFLA